MAQANPDMIRGISARAQAAGAIAHRFYGSEGKIMVVDEWPDAASFHAFFEAEQANIGPMMEQVATSEPEITLWRKLETEMTSAGSSPHLPVSAPTSSGGWTTTCGERTTSPIRTG